MGICQSFGINRKEVVKNSIVGGLIAPADLDDFMEICIDHDYLAISKSKTFTLSDSVAFYIVISGSLVASISKGKGNEAFIDAVTFNSGEILQMFNLSPSNINEKGYNVLYILYYITLYYILYYILYY